MNDLFYFVNILCWLFVIGVFLCIVLGICLHFYYTKLLQTERTEFREELQLLRESHNQERADLLNRLMASSYAEYESYEIEKMKEHSKPKPSNNFIKETLDRAEREYIEERQYEG